MKLGVAVVVVFTVLAPSSALAQAAAAPAQHDVLGELLTEVRSLRQAMERAATVGARIQLLVARIQLQEQRITESARRLSAVRDELSKIDTQVSGLAGQSAQFEKATSGMPQEQRDEMLRMVETFKTQAAILEKRKEELTNEESLLLQQVSADQGRWSDINAQLDDLDRSLTAPPKK
jgi:hypothetical protein